MTTKILAIETSCDETAVAVLECDGNTERANVRVLGNALYSQIETHAEYGGVYPALAKREHQSNLAPLATEALKTSGMFSPSEEDSNEISETVLKDIRDEEFKQSIASFLMNTAKPAIDMIAVTRGPGLEPALWTGINFAEALGKAWRVPVVGIDHMEGHIMSALLKRVGSGQWAVGSKRKAPEHYTLNTVRLPLLSLLISGGHTELVLMKEWFVYEIVGKTKDDAVGEAFDKVARLLELSYPGGPKIAELADKSRAKGVNEFTFTTPMAHDPTCDFSFSGLKTAVMYKLKKMDKLSETDKENIAEAFENAARDALLIKTRKALQENNVHTLVIAGGVSANEEIRKSFLTLTRTEFPHLTLALPDKALTGDNAIMIGAAAYLRKTAGKAFEEKLIAQGKLRLEARS